MAPPEFILLCIVSDGVSGLELKSAVFYASNLLAIEGAPLGSTTLAVIVVIVVIVAVVVVGVVVVVVLAVGAVVVVAVAVVVVVVGVFVAAFAVVVLHSLPCLRKAGAGHVCVCVCASVPQRATLDCGRLKAPRRNGVVIWMLLMTWAFPLPCDLTCQLSWDAGVICQLLHAFNALAFWAM